MKKFFLLAFLIALLIPHFLKAQYIYKIKADSVRIYNDSCTAELILENKTKDTLGFLYNRGNGRTEFRRALIPLDNKKYLIGRDTLDLSGSGGSATWGSISGTLSNQMDLQNALDSKQTTLVSGTNIKTINGSSILGSGNLIISGGNGSVSSVNNVSPIDGAVTVGTTHYNSSIQAQSNGVAKNTIFRTGNTLKIKTQISGLVSIEGFYAQPFIKENYFGSCLLLYGYSFLSSINNEDSYGTSGNGISIKEGGTYLSQDGRQTTTDDTISLHVQDYRFNTHWLVITGSEFEDPLGYTVILFDSVTGTYINVPTTGSITYPFTMTTNYNTRFTLRTFKKLNLRDGIILSFADNAAAILGGLGIGDIYREGDILKIVH